MAARLRVQLGFSPPGDAPVRFWWQPPQGAGTIEELLQRLGADLGLEPSQRSRLAATMDGFVVLGGSRTDLLRDGDTLLVSLGNKRGLAGDEPADSGGAAVQPPAAKRHKPQVLPATAPESSSSEEESSSSEEESSSSEEESSSSKEESSSSESKGSGRQQDMQTPTAAAPIANNATTGKRPSRSARRKAAKRRLRRLGVLPAGKGAAAAAAVHAAAPAVAAAAKQQSKSAAQAERPTQAAPQQPALVVQAQALAGQQRQQQQQPQKQLPEVVVPAEWQPGAGKRHGQQHKQRGGKQQPTQQPPQQGSFHAVPPPVAAAATAAVRTAAPAPQPALDEAAFGQLPPLEGEPCVGDVLAYRLLEIGAGLQPSVSEARCGRVTEVAPPAITLAPHPDVAVHPLSYQRALRRAQRLQAAAAAGDEAEAEEDSDDEEFGSQYDEEGLLTAELASFVELRMLQPAAGQRNKQATPANSTAAAAAAAAATTVHKASVTATEPAARLAPAQTNGANGGSAADEGLGPSSYSQLGPPRPASRGDLIAAEGGWASLYEQLRQRRAQLVGQSGEAAQQQGAATAEAGTPKALPQQGSGSAAKAVRSAPPAAGREHNNSNRAVTHGGRGPGSLTPGATRPRAGVRRTALGPMLRMLRASQELS